MHSNCCDENKSVINTKCLWVLKSWLVDDLGFCIMKQNICGNNLECGCLSCGTWSQTQPVSKLGRAAGGIILHGEPLLWPVEWDTFVSGSWPQDPPELTKTKEVGKVDSFRCDTKVTWVNWGNDLDLSTALTVHRSIDSALCRTMN